jgi:hypothetical protein
MLSGKPGRSPEEVVGRILAVQAQDPRGARLAIRVRSAGLTAADVDLAFTDDRSIVITWLNRGTLHLVRREDYPWLLALCGPRQLPWIRTRLGQLGVAPDAVERGVAVIVSSLAEEGPLTRAELAERLTSQGVPTGGQAIVHLIGVASLRGHVIRGPMRGREQCLVLTRDWLGEPAPVDRDRALTEMSRRYLAGHGPATERDLAYWAGITVRDARAGLRSIGPELDERGDGLVDLARREPAPDLPSPRLLGPFDPLLHGWASREPIVGRHGFLVTSNGIFRATLLVGGRAVGTWGFAGGRVRLEPFEELDETVLDALEADAVDVLRYFTASPD